MDRINYDSEEEFNGRIEEVLNHQSRWLSRRIVRDFQNPLTYYNNEEFRKRYRFRKETVVDILVPLIQHAFQLNSDARGLPLSPLHNILIALRYYSTGIFQIVSGDLITISQSLICRVIRKVSRLICLHCSSYLKFPADLNNIKQKFYNIAHFPGVIACVDGTHIKIKNPGGQYAEVYRNRHRYFSINVQITCGPGLEIYDMVANRPGSTHDSRIFDNNHLKYRLESGQLRGILLGDSGYPNRTYLLTPYQQQDNDIKKRYNEAHIRTRNTVERTIGVWKRIFPCLKSTLATKLTTTCHIIVATAILYNILRGRNEIEENTANDSVNRRELREHFIQNTASGLAFRNAFAVQHFA